MPYAIQEKSGENRRFEAENVDLGEKPAVFSNGENRRKTGRRSPRNGLFSVLRRGMGANGESAQVPCVRGLAEKRKPVNG